MQALRFKVLAIASVALVGCSEKDPNKNLKPASADAPKPSAVGGPSTPGGATPGPTMKAPAAVVD